MAQAAVAQVMFPLGLGGLEQQTKEAPVELAPLGPPTTAALGVVAQERSATTVVPPQEEMAGMVLRPQLLDRLSPGLVAGAAGQPTEEPLDQEDQVGAELGAQMGLEELPQRATQAVAAVAQERRRRVAQILVVREALASSSLNTQTHAQYPTPVVALHIRPQLLAALLSQPLLLAQAMSLGVSDGTLRIS